MKSEGSAQQVSSSLGIECKVLSQKTKPNKKSYFQSPGVINTSGHMSSYHRVSGQVQHGAQNRASSRSKSILRGPGSPPGFASSAVSFSALSLFQETILGSVKHRPSCVQSNSIYRNRRSESEQKVIFFLKGRHSQ